MRPQVWKEQKQPHDAARRQKNLSKEGLAGKQETADAPFMDHGGIVGADILESRNGRRVHGRASPRSKKDGHFRSEGSSEKAGSGQWIIPRNSRIP